MDDHVAGVDQDPIRLAHPLDAGRTMAALFELLDQMGGERRDVAMRTATGDNHVIGDGSFSGKVDNRNVLGLVVFERADGDAAHRLGRHRLGGIAYRLFPF